MHGIDNMSGVEAGLVANIDYCRAAIDHAYCLGSRDFQQGTGAQLYLNNHHSHRHEYCCRNQKRVGCYKFEESVHIA